MKHVTDRIQAWLGGELDAERSAALERHLAECPDCAREAERSRELWDLLAAGEARPASDSVWPAVQARTFGAAGSWFYGGRALTRTGWAAAAVACGLMLAVLLPLGVGAGNGNVAMASDGSMWLTDSSWLAETDEAGLHQVWLDAGLDDEEGGS